MRAPKRKRPRRRVILAPDARPDASIARRARYVGSPEHKDAPSFAGAPRRRADASICDRRFLGQQAKLTRWLRKAIQSGSVGAPIEGEFPRYVWFKEGGNVYEGRLVNRTSGEYKGFKLRPDEWPSGLSDIYG